VAAPGLMAFFIGFFGLNFPFCDGGGGIFFVFLLKVSYG
jgi:hypothetical protein